MPVVDVTIGKRAYQLACDAGQEEHLQHLASGVDGRLQELSGLLEEGSSDALLLVMASLMLQDELNEVKEKIVNGDAGVALRDAETQAQEVDIAVCDAIDAISEYVENIADRLEKR